MDKKALFDTIIFYVFYIFIIINIFKLSSDLKIKNKFIFNFYLKFSILISFILILSLYWPKLFLLLYFILLAPISIIILFLIITSSMYHYTFSFYGINFTLYNIDLVNYFINIGQSGLNPDKFILFIFLLLIYLIGISQWVLLFNFYVNKNKNIYLKLLFLLYIIICLIVFSVSCYYCIHPTVLDNNCSHGNVGCPAGHL